MATSDKPYTWDTHDEIGPQPPAFFYAITTSVVAAWVITAAHLVRVRH